MAKYRVGFIEKIFYDVCVEADNEEEAKEKAEELFSNGDESVDVANQYVSDIWAEEEE